MQSVHMQKTLGGDGGQKDRMTGGNGQKAPETELDREQSIISPPLLSSVCKAISGCLGEIINKQKQRFRDPDAAKCHITQNKYALLIYSLEERKKQKYMNACN